jgi:hypothetical protein
MTLRVLDLLHERQGESLPQHAEFASGKLRETFSRRDLSTLQDLRERGDGFDPQPTAKKRRAHAPGYDSTLLALPGGCEPQTGKLGLRGRGLCVPVRLLSHEHLPGDHHEFASGSHDGHIAILALAQAPEEGAEGTGVQTNTLVGLHHHRPGVPIAVLRNAPVVAAGGRLSGSGDQA